MDRMQPITLTAAAYSLTAEAHSGTTLVVNRAAGMTLTLPPSMGYGTEFDVYLLSSITSNNLIIQAANSSDTMSGICYTAQDAGDTVAAYETAADSDTITMNGSTKGGIKGDRIKLKSITPTVWSVQIFSSGTGTEATPFSAAV